MINGTFDWVYEEEFRLRDGWRWSPDGAHIAFWQLDASGIRDFLLIDNTDSLYSFVKPVQYPKAGTVNSAARVGVISSHGGPIVWFEPSDDLRNHYINRMGWAAGSDTIFLQQLNRLQNHLQVILGNISTGAMETVFEERDDAWVDVRSDDMRWFDDGAYFTWVSESDGWRRIYVISRDGSEVRAISPEGEDVIGEIVVDEASGSIYYTAAPGDPTRRYLYRVPIDGSRPAVRVTPEVPGTHTYQIAPGGAWAIHTFSTFDTPSVIDLVSLPSHETRRVLMSNETLRRRLAALQLPKLEFFRVDIGDTELDGWVMKPTDFDPSKKYPVLFYVYGEAANQTVKDAWPGERGLWHRLLTDLGIVVVSVDNRGTPSPRGRAWRKFGYGSVGYQSSADQAKAAREIRKWPFIDSTRVGVWGWSGGGTSTLNAMFRYPEVYDVGISVAPVTDRRYYDTIYQERYMGLPQDNPEGYRLGSPITFAQRLQGDLLLIHGTGDDNVHYQNSEALINRLVEYNKLFSFMSYPNRTHSISEGAGTRRHLYGTMTRYLMDKLLPAR